MEALRDSWGREIRSVRVSVTDKCNFRCRYCMPAEGLEWLERDELLSFEELSRLGALLPASGGYEGRMSGGEASVPPGPPLIGRLLAGLPRRRELCPTPNGVLLYRPF